MTTLTKWTDEKIEEALFQGASIEEPWALIERFSTLVRESGSEDEWTAARYIGERLEALGVEFTVHEPELFLSIPKRARLEVVTAEDSREIRVKTPVFSVSTGDRPIETELVYVPTGQAKGMGDLFGATPEVPEGLEGKVVITEGNPLPGKVDAFSKAGILAMIFVGPGENIHEGTVTPIWGAPDLDNFADQPKMAVLGVNRSEGAWLIDRCQSGSVRALLNTWLDEGWMRCPLVEATIRSEAQPEKFVLVHGHIDSWHVGIGDNATGNATLLEVARLLQAHQHHLKRTVKVCWWPGHSQGRYGGSTWYADRFALELDTNCVGHINCDSPGCRWATVYEDVMWMPEAEDIASGAIETATGQKAKGIRPLRAGDISFNNIGISTFYMLSSTMPKDLLEEKGYHAVGGCGGNIEWHTEEDTLQIADKEILLKDIKVYASAVLRLANSPIVAFDYRKTIDDLAEHLGGYQEAAGGRVSFEIALNAAQEARSEIDRLMVEAEKLAQHYDVRDERVAKVNDALMRIGRHLVSVGFSERGKFHQESALNVPPIPAVAPAARLRSLEENSHLDRVTRTHVTRSVNAVAWSFKEATREARAVLEFINRS